MKKILFFVLLLLFSTQFAFAEGEMIACTADAMQCPDGTWVGRTGPNCEFLCDKTPSIKTPEIFCTMEYDPVCGIVDMGIRCITTPCPSTEEKTFSNKCMANKAGAEILHEGECLVKDTPEPETIPDGSPEDPKITDNCISWFDGCNNCRRAEDGGPAMCTLMYCENPGEPYCIEFSDDETRPELVADENLPEPEPIIEEIRIVNKIQTKKLFGIFPLSLKTELHLDEAGEIIKEKKPWYSFLLF